MEVMSVNVGRPALLSHGGRRYSSAINRRRVEGAIELTEAGLAGDRVADAENHGGPDKALCCYPHEHYRHWSEQLASTLEIPAFGENLTVAGLLEDQVAIGDTFRIGTATVQISQPRQPCAKLARKHDHAELVRWVEQTGYTGFYLRTLEPGSLQAGDAIEPLDHPHPELTVARVMAVRFDRQPDADLLERLVDTEALSIVWREALAKRRANRPPS